MCLERHACTNAQAHIGSRCTHNCTSPQTHTNSHITQKARHITNQHSLTHNTYTQASSTPAPPEPPAQYVAGCVHVPAPASCQDANLMLAFETKGGWHDVKGAVIMTVLMQLMGGGSSFSSGVCV